MNVKAQVGETFTITTSSIPGRSGDSCYLELIFTIASISDNLINCKLDVYANKTGTVGTIYYKNVNIRDNGGNIYSNGSFVVPRTTTRQKVVSSTSNFTFGPNSLTILYDAGGGSPYPSYTDSGYVGLYKSLRFNNSQVINLYFNGTQVKSVYLNGTKIDSY